MLGMERIGEQSILAHSTFIFRGRREVAQLIHSVNEASAFRGRLSGPAVALAEVLTNVTSKTIGAFELTGRGISHIVLSPFKKDKFARMGILYFTAALNAVANLFVTILLSPVSFVTQTYSIITKPKEAIPFEKAGFLEYMAAATGAKDDKGSKELKAVSKMTFY